MSKATEWFKRVTEPPPKGIQLGDVTMTVGVSELCSCRMEIPIQNDEAISYLTHAEAISLADWIYDTFGEQKQSDVDYAGGFTGLGD